VPDRFRHFPERTTYSARDLVGLAVIAALFIVVYELRWWTLAVLGGLLLLLVLYGVVSGVRQGVREVRGMRTAEPSPAAPLGREGAPAPPQQSQGVRLQAQVLQVVGDTVGLFICGRFVPGATVHWPGLVIAVAVISVPLIAVGIYLDSSRARHWAVGFLVALLWLFCAPAVADRVTPDFNISGVWQYLIVLAVLYLSGFAGWRIVEASKRLLAKGR
jgi:hypothetical protein